MNLLGDKILLRAMEPEDMEMYRIIINDPDTELMVGGWSFPVSVKEQIQWYEQAVMDKNNLRFTIVELECNTIIGMVNLINIDWKNRSAFHGIKLAPNAPKGQGYGTDAVMTIMKYAFEELQLNRLDGSWVEYNLASIRLYEKCGWKIEGTKEQSIFNRGKYYDSYFGGILSKYYYEVKKNMRRL